LDILLLTGQADGESALPSLQVIAPAARYGALRAPAVWKYDDADIAIIDARTDLVAARQACRKIATTAPSVAVVAVVSPEDFVVVDPEWHVDDVVLATACPAELHARLRLAVARRRTVAEGDLQFGDLVLHPASYGASLHNRELDLTLTEFKLLNFLVQHAGQAFTRTRLMREVWGHECGRRTVDVHVQRLRAKLGAEQKSLVDTVRGVGYMATGSPPHFVAEAPPAGIAMAQ
jgi:DNA-binding response OmpR family regulator